jgi:hypothetical protein
MSSLRLHMCLHIAAGVAAEDLAPRRDATACPRRRVAGDVARRPDLGESHVRMPVGNEHESAMAKNTTPFIAVSELIDCIVG